MTKKTISTLGGMALLKKYGKEYYRNMGIRSAQARRNKLGTEKFKQVMNELSAKGVQARTVNKK